MRSAATSLSCIIKRKTRAAHTGRRSFYSGSRLLKTSVMRPLLHLLDGRVSSPFFSSILTPAGVCVIIYPQLCRTAARHGAERYCREESPGFTGQDS